MWRKTLNLLDHTTTPQQAAAYWGADKHSVRLVSEGINLIYRFEINGCGKYLRITHEAIRSVDEVQAAIHFQCYLAEQHVPVPSPRPSLAGRWVERVRQQDVEYLAQVVDEVPGESMHFEHADLSVYHAWGRALATLHAAAGQYQPAPEAVFKKWDDLQRELEVYIQRESRALQDEFATINEQFATFTLDQTNFGLTHADHRAGNVIYDGHQVYLIDFDEPVYHWFVADIARPFLNIYLQEKTNWQEKLFAYLKGYQTIKPIRKEDLQLFPWFIRLKVMDMYLWTKNNWHNPIAPGGGARADWLAELRQMILHPMQDSLFEEVLK